jgi:uncharacterized damage-inducible protein DinB
MVDVKDLLAYNQEIRHRYLDAIAKLPWSEAAKDRGASWGSIRNIFVHTMGATDYWIDFLKGEKLRSQKKYDEYQSIDDVRAYMDHVEKRFNKYLASLTSDSLKKKYRLKNDNEDKEIDVTAEDVLIHVFEEEVHHRGELIALLWQMDIEPPLMGWRSL